MKEVQDHHNTIETLRNDEEYYSGIGRKYLSNSDIGKLLGNPKEFGVPQDDNINFAKGRHFHQMILEPEKAKNVRHVDASTRSTKLYKNFLEETGLPFCMLTKEKEGIEENVKTMLGNFEFYQSIRAEGNLYEEPAIGEIKGLMWKGKADIITKDCIIDLKTTGNINDFKWSARKYNYDSQCYIYQTLFGKPLVFYAIDKGSNMLGMFTPSEDFISRGEEKVERAIEVYKKFFIDDAPKKIDDYYINDVI
mgnify:FL=1|jgi:hypothetical protein|tara:strand:+ start:4568 stop:5317 length:750 start_codon:yes stop_codon:yes gene_type:complete